MVPVPRIDGLVRQLPRHEFAIRRLYASDPEFRAVCCDYCEVRRALEYWQVTDRSMPERVEEYRRMLDELEAEVLAAVNAFRHR
jgi:outer membrane protein assembly factor BamD (BamD/ComL family)